MDSNLIDIVISQYNYWIYFILMMIGFYAMIVKNNLIKKVIGMNIFQAAIILFYVSIGAKKDATIPIIEHGEGHGHVIHAIDPTHYINPLPHVLMLTAIVVSVSTLGVALALVSKIYGKYGTIEEDEIAEKLK